MLCNVRKFVMIIVCLQWARMVLYGIDYVHRAVAFISADGRGKYDRHPFDTTGVMVQYVLVSVMGTVFAGTGVG
jgi:hypothetical protein